MKTLSSNPFLRHSLVLCSIVIAAAIQSVSAGNVWDGGGGTGNWSDLSNWDSNTTPVSPTGLQFGGTLQLNSNNDLFAVGTLFNGITFNAGAGAFILSGNSINLGGNVANNSASNQTINLDLALTGSRTFTTSASGNLTLGGVVSGTGFNFIKSGFGTLTFNGSLGSSYTGQTQVSGGTLMLDFAHMATATNLLSSTSTIQTGGGELYIKGKSSGATSQTLGNLTQANTSFSKVTVDSNGGGGTTLALGTVTHATGNVTLFDVSTSGSAITTATGSANTVMNAGFIVKDSSGIGFAVKNGANTNIVRYDDAALTTILASGATVSTTNYSTLNSAASVSLNAGALSMNSLVVDTTNGARSIDLGTGIKTLVNNGILFRGSNNATISNGQIGANNAETIIHQLGTGKLTISGTVGSGTANLTKSGSGEVELSGVNTYTGATRVLDGTLTVTNSLGATAINVGGTTGTQGTAAVLNLGAGSSITGGSITLSNVNSTVNQTQANAISNTTTFTNTAGTLNLNVDNSTAWTSGAFVAANAAFTLGIGHDNALGARTLSLSGNTNIRSNGGAHVVSAILTLDQSTVTGSNDLTFSGLATWQNTTTFTVNNTGLTTFSGGLNLRSGTTAQRTMTVAGTGNINFASVIANGSSLNGIMDFKGSGTHTLGAANTYSGTTTIGGVLNGGNTSPVVKLGNGAGLGFGGASAVVGNTTVNSGAVLDLNGQVGIQEPIAINGTGIANSGALINSNTSTEAVIENGVASVGVGPGGTGYTDGSYAITFTGGGGTGAAGTANVVGGVVVSVQVTNAGSGYTSNPTASITGGGGTGAVINTSASSVALASASSIGGAGNIRINAPVTGTNALTKVGAGTLTLGAPNSYSGTTTISGGKLALTGSGSISSSPQITVGASTTFDVSGVTGGYTLASTQTLSGTGTVVGSASIAGTLSPGSSPGSLATGSQTWLDGGDYNWQIADATGTAGVGYDTISLAGTLDLSNLSAAGFSINLWSLASIGPDVNGNAANFINTTSYSWILLTTTGGITGFDAADFAIRTGAFNGTGGFTNAPGDGLFSLSQSGNDLVLNFTVVPEPATALLGSLAVLTLLRRRRPA